MTETPIFDESLSQTHDPKFRKKLYRKIRTIQLRAQKLLDDNKELSPMGFPKNKDASWDSWNQLHSAYVIETDVLLSKMEELRPIIEEENGRILRYALVCIREKILAYRSEHSMLIYGYKLFLERTLKRRRELESITKQDIGFIEYEIGLLDEDFL